jgi:hypothetical protein
VGVFGYAQCPAAVEARQRLQALEVGMMLQPLGDRRFEVRPALAAN